MAGSVLLIVVDQPAHRALFNRYLGNGPHHLVFSTDGEDAFDRFAEVKPDLVIAHVDVPRLDGTILCQLIRQQPRGDKVPYVLLSEKFSDLELAEQRVLVVGADGYLPFPFDRSLLLERIMSLLSFGRGDGAAPPKPASGERKPLSGPQAVLERAPIEGPASHLEEKETIRPDDSADPAGPNLHEEPIAPPLPANRALADSADTVVSFMNPYQSGDLLVRPQQPQIADDVATAGGGDAELIERPTLPFEDQTDSPMIRIHMDPTTPEPIPAQPPRPLKLFIPESKTLKNTPRQESVAAPSWRDRELKPSIEDPLREPPIPGRDHSGSGLEELPISELQDPEGSEKRRLIEELPRETTPSASEKGVKGGVVREALVAGVRRGLDESQLGKRLVKRVRTMYRLLDQVDYYQILGVDRDASDQALKRAYFDLSLEFHPDRFFLLRSGDVKEKIYAIYRRVTEAYTVLSDERRRHAYEEGLRGSNSKRAAPEIRERDALARAPTELAPASNGNTAGQKPSDVPAAGAKPPAKLQPFEVEVAVKDPRAKKLVDQARAAMRDGDLHGVRLHLHLAKAYERNNRELDAVLGQVVSEEKRLKAER